MSFNTPILFLIYNRPSKTEIVFSIIRQVKPKKLYIAADGPNEKKEDDSLKCEKTREIINLIDWDWWDVKKLFSSHNKGCRLASVDAINWFFGYVEEGINLEDDNYPSLLFSVL